VAVTGEDGDRAIYVLPIAHTPPANAADAVELPQTTKVRLGLDSERSWVVVTEGNSFIWPGPDLRPRPGQGPGSSAYGMLPPTVFNIVKQRFFVHVRSLRAGVVKRTE